jgi:hypothetical protein
MGFVIDYCGDDRNSHTVLIVNLDGSFRYLNKKM